VTLPATYFEELYERSPDPWGFRTRWYERRKRTVVLASLLQEGYATAFEPGCSNGVLTAALVDRVDRLLAMDISPQALATAAGSLTGKVELRRGQVPHDWPDGDFDLVIVSEVAYYLDPPDCARLAELATVAAEELVVVHWRHPVADYPLSGDQAHAIFSDVASRGGLEHMISHCEADFRLDTWSRDHRSVAQRAGLVST
jgi:SAM-dependent methyltransferase